MNVAMAGKDSLNERKKRLATKINSQKTAFEAEIKPFKICTDEKNDKNEENIILMHAIKVLCNNKNDKIAPFISNMKKFLDKKFPKYTIISDSLTLTLDANLSCEENYETIKKTLIDTSFERHKGKISKESIKTQLEIIERAGFKKIEVII